MGISPGKTIEMVTVLLGVTNHMTMGTLWTRRRSRKRTGLGLSWKLRSKVGMKTVALVCSVTQLVAVAAFNTTEDR
jgi:hypothetical protein